MNYIKRKSSKMIKKLKYPKVKHTIKKSKTFYFFLIRIQFKYGAILRNLGMARDVQEAAFQSHQQLILFSPLSHEY